MSVLRSVTSIRSPTVAVIGGPGTWPLYVQAPISRPDPSRTAAVCAVSRHRLVVHPGAGVLPPLSSAIDTAGPNPYDRSGPPPVATDSAGMNSSPTPVAPVLATTTPPAMPMNWRRESRDVSSGTWVGVISASRAVPAGTVATTRAVSSAPAPTSEPAINAVLQVSGYPTRTVTRSPTRAAYPAVSSTTTAVGGIPSPNAAGPEGAGLAAASNRGPAIRTAANPATPSIGRPNNTFSCANHQPRSASTATVLSRARVTNTAAASSPSASRARPAAAAAPAADHAVTERSATTWSAVIN